MVPTRTNEGLFLAATWHQAPKKAPLPGGYSLRSVAATAAVSSFDLGFNAAADDDDDDGGSRQSDPVVDATCAVGRNDSTRLRRRRTTMTAAGNAVVAPLVVAAAAAVDEARASDGFPEEGEENAFSETRSGRSVTTRLAGNRENGVGNGKGEVCLPLEKEEKGDGAEANTSKTDGSVADDVDADKNRDMIVEEASEVAGANSSVVGDESQLQERLRDIGFVRQEVDDLRRSRDSQNKGRAPLEARKLQKRGLVQETIGESAKPVEGVAPVPVLNHGRGASREGRTEEICQESSGGRGVATFSRDCHDGEESEGVEEDEDDRVREDDTETNENKEEEEEDQGDNEDKRGKDGEEEQEYKECRKGKEDGEDKEDEEDKQNEEKTQTEEEQRASLETSVRLLRLVLASIAWSFRSFLLLSTPEESVQNTRCYRGDSGEREES